MFYTHEIHAQKNKNPWKNRFCANFKQTNEMSKFVILATSTG